jgi:hypothetical protein
VSADTTEVPLIGGYTNAGRVVRVGATVRRPRTATSAAAHALLEHLERVGFEGAPRLLGIDARGREVLTYIEGTAVVPPYPAWALSDGALAGVAALIRAYHEAVASFDPAPYAWPSSVPEPFGGRLVTHNDPNLDNVVFRDGRAVALIDFDLACPGSAVWDVACAARLWVPLRDERDVPELLRGRTLERLALFAEAYGLAQADRRRLIEALPLAHAWCYRIVRRAVAEGHETFKRVWREGAADRAQRTQHWLAAHAGDLEAALGLRRGRRRRSP